MSDNDTLEVALEETEPYALTSGDSQTCEAGVVTRNGEPSASRYRFRSSVVGGPSSGPQWVRATRTEDEITKLGRNDPCHCGSKKKYKKCHLAADSAERTAELSAKNAAAIEAAREAAEADPEGAADKEGAKTEGFGKGGGRSAKPKAAPPARKTRRRGVA